MSSAKQVLLLVPLALSAALYWLFTSEPAAPWLASTPALPLGTDEFGRDVVATALAATGLSLLKGLTITAITLVLALVIAEILTLRVSRRTEPTIRVAASIVESVPAVLWVMIALIAVSEPRFVVVTLAFALVTLPSALNITAGELLRLRAEPFVEAAYLLGVEEPRVLFRYILPNATAILLPYAIQVLGAAIAVDGAIGVIGLGNRSDLDLGIFLLRGKENFVLHPQLLLTALVMYGLVYGYLLWVSRSLASTTHKA